MKFFAIAMIALVFAACSAQQNNAHAKKLKFIKQHEHEGHKSGKARRLQDTAIRMVKSDDETVTFQASVKASKDIKKGQIEWKLPESAVVVEGSLQKNIDLSEGIEQTFQIQVKKESLKAGDKIFFFSYKMKKGERHGTPAMFIYGQVKKSNDQKSLPTKFKDKKIVQ